MADKNLQIESKPTTPEERLIVAVEGRNNHNILRESVVYVGERVIHKYPDVQVIESSRYMGSVEFSLVSKEKLPLVKSRVSISRNANVLEVCVDDADLNLTCEETIRLINGQSYSINSFRRDEGIGQLIY